MRYRVCLAGIALCAAIWLPRAVTGQDKPADATQESTGTQESVSESEDDAMQAVPETPAEKARRIASPGEKHEKLEAFVGDWDTTIRVWRRPGEDPEETAGTAETRWILDGRFIETVYKGAILGHQVEANVVEGYDNRAREFVATWRDTMGTYTLIFRGTCDADCEVWTKEADLIDPISGRKLINKAVTTIVDEDSYKYESFIVIDEERQFKNMELVAQRRP